MTPKEASVAPPASQGDNASAPGCNPSHSLRIRVYYEDTDFSGVVYHASYLRFLERGRTEYLRARGIESSTLLAEGLAFAVYRMSLEFVRPARMDDEICVETRVGALGGASIEMIQKISRGAELLLEARVRIAIVAGGRATRLPPGLVAKLKAEPGK